MINSEDASPNPEYLIKSIAEQGYSLETSIADLIDNSLSANADKIEILIDFESYPFTLFLADNGDGMSEEELKQNMQFPSNSPEHHRNSSDLGRFGLGMKTASFSQTRLFSVLSRTKGTKKFNGRTWDVDFLRDHGWKIIVNSKEDIDETTIRFKNLSDAYFNGLKDFEANTIVVWKGLYKFDNFLKTENRKKALQKEVSEITSDYLALVFHRYFEREINPIQIRINNHVISPFNPFPEKEKDLRALEFKQRDFGTDYIKMEGFVLPSRSIDESRKGQSVWTTKHRGLMDMEGIYVYRLDRIILFGGWNGLIKKAARLQLARLRVEVGNSIDQHLHLNVAKSNIVVPHELRAAFERYIHELKSEAEREYFNRGIRKFSGKKKTGTAKLFERHATSKGSLLEINPDFPLLATLVKDFSKKQRSMLQLLLRMINNRVNEIRHVHEETEFVGIPQEDGLSLDTIEKCIVELLDNGVSPSMIKASILPQLGYKMSSLPETIKNLIK